MAIKDKSVTISFFVQDAANGGGKTGDAANLSARIISDGTGSAPTNSIAEIDATNAKGWYKLVVTAGENAGAMMSLAVQSTTADIYSAGAAWTNEHNVAAVSEDEVAADNLELACDNYSVTRGLSGTALPAAAADAAGGLIISDAGGFNIDAVTVTTNAAIADAVWEEAIADHSGTVGSTAEALNGASAPTAAAIADAVWDETLAGHVTASTFGLVLQSINAATATTEANVVSILDDTGTTLPAQIAALNDPTAGAIADAVWDELQSGHTTAGTFGKYLDTEVSGVGGGVPPTAAAIADAVWTETLADHSGTAGSTAEALNAAGSAGDPWTTALPGSYTGSQAGKMLSDILVDTGTTIPAQITGLNNLSAAAVNAEVDIALADYDGPTKAELDSGLAALNDPTAGAVADAVWDELQSGHVTAGSFGEIATEIAAVLADTDELQTNQGNWLTATSTTASNAPTNWSLMDINLSGEITTSNPALGGGSAHTAEDVRDLILAGDKTPIAVATGSVSNVVLVDTTTDLTNGGVGGDTKEDIYTYFTTLSREEAFWADLAGISTFDPVSDSVVASNMRGTDGANTVAPDNAGVAAIKAKTDQFVFTVANQVDANALTGGGGDDAATIYTYFTAGTNEDVFKADVSGIEAVTSKLDTGLEVDGSGGYQYTALALENTPNAAGGSGIYQVTVRVQDITTDALNGARVNIDGTTLTLTTPVSGEVVFNLDSGTYDFDVVPPSGYDTPVTQQLVVSSDGSLTFTLAESNPGGGNEVPPL